MGCFYSPWGQEHWRWNGTLHCSLGLTYDLTWPTLGLVYGTDKFLSLRWQRSGFISCFRYMLLKSRTLFLLKKNKTIRWYGSAREYDTQEPVIVIGVVRMGEHRERAERETACLGVYVCLQWASVWYDGEYMAIINTGTNTVTRTRKGKRKRATIRWFLLWLFSLSYNACNDLWC